MAVRDRDLLELVDLFSRSTVIVDKSYHLRTYKQCFTGRELIDWLIANGRAVERAEALTIGEELLRADLLHHVVDEHSFEDTDNLFFRLVQHEPPEILKKRKTIPSLKDVVLMTSLCKQKFSGSKKACFVLTSTHLYEYSCPTSGCPNAEWAVISICEVSMKHTTIIITFKNGQDLRVVADSSSVHSQWLHAFHSLGLGARVSMMPVPLPQDKFDAQKVDKRDVAVVGCTRSGKTILINRLCGATVEETLPTIENLIFTTVCVDGGACHLRILDTSGCDEYAELRPSWVQNKDAIIIVFCNTSHSINIAIQWGHFARAYDTLVPVVFTCTAGDAAFAATNNLNILTAASSLAAKFIPCVSDEDSSPPFHEAVRIARSITHRVKGTPSPDQILRAEALTTATHPSPTCQILFNIPVGSETIAGYSCCYLDEVSSGYRSLRGQLIATTDSLIFQSLIPSPMISVALCDVQAIESVRTENAILVKSGSFEITFVDFLCLELAVKTLSSLTIHYCKRK